MWEEFLLIKAAEIIYGGAFEKLGFKTKDLKPYNGTLVGVTNEATEVRGFVEAETIFGRGKSIRKTMVRYLLLACSATYNVLIGRHTINDIGAVFSPVHLNMKYSLCQEELVSCEGVKNTRKGGFEL